MKHKGPGSPTNLHKKTRKGRELSLAARIQKFSLADTCLVCDRHDAKPMACHGLLLTTHDPCRIRSKKQHPTSCPWASHRSPMLDRVTAGHSPALAMPFFANRICMAPSGLQVYLEAEASSGFMYRSHKNRRFQGQGLRASVKPLRLGL